MEVKVGPIEEGKTSLTITGDAEQVDAAYQRVLRELRREVRLPGFRRGKAPEALLTSMIGQDQINERVSRSLIEETLPEALRTTPWVPLENPAPEVLRCERGEPFEYRLSGPLAKVELTEVAPLKVSRFNATVTPEMAAEHFDGQREQQARFRMSENSVVQPGDTVNLSLKISHQGQVIDQYGPPRALRVDVGRDRLRLPVGEHLLGMGRDQEKVVLVTCPDDYPQEEVRNQQVECYLKVLDILEKVLPDENEFALTLGEYANAEEARQGLQQNLQAYYDAMAQNQAENSLMSQIVDESQIELPEEFLAERIEDELEDLQSEAEEHSEDRRPSEEDLRQMAEQRGTQGLQSEAVLRHVAFVHNLRPTREDLAEEVSSMARANNVSAEAFAERLAENEQMPEILDRARLRLAMLKLMEVAQVEELSVSDLPAPEDADAVKDEETDVN